MILGALETKRKIMLCNVPVYRKGKLGQVLYV